MIYKGIEYEYALEFLFPVFYNPDGEIFRIVVTDFLEEIQGYSGLCLENELYVTLENKIVEYDAFIDIINKIVNITTSAITDCIKVTKCDYIPKPNRKVDDEDFLRLFNERKASNGSQYYQKLLDKHYDTLRKYFTNPHLITPEAYKKLEAEVRFCLTVWYVHLYICARKPQIRELNIFKL